MNSTGRQPEKLGIYYLQRLLGKGGMGAVYLAVDPTLRRQVALKVLAPELAADHEYVARFHREATSLARIRHPNLVHIYAVGEDANRHFIAMEYLKGQSVADLLRQHGPLPHPSAVRILGQVLSALDKVHAAGIVHRDLKPANIMIDEDQRAILTDFGLAKPRHDRSVTTGNTLLGTPEYMAPELAEGREADFRTDIYALGVILFELVTGRVPFQSTSAIATLRQHIETPTPSARGLTPALPPQLDAVIARAMAKKPEERYQSVRALAADLVAVTRTHELADLAAGGGAAAQETVAADFAAAAATTPTIPAETPSTATVSEFAKGSTEPLTCPTVPTAPGARRWRLVAVGAVGTLVLLLAVVGALALGRRLLGPPAPKASQKVYVVHARGRSPVTGRLLRGGGEKGSWVVKTEGGTVEIPYSEVTKIEPQVGR
ncbi:MAG: serine/threonine protein kinase [Planctomycetes bacterium]|nr:serine/threonine protein kinase [Planctomycetota bacterium]